MHRFKANISKFAVWLGNSLTIASTAFAKTGTKIAHIDDTGNTKTYDYARPSFANTQTQLEINKGYLILTTTNTDIDPALVTGFGVSPIPSPLPGGNVFTDDFSGSSLNSAWKKINEPSAKPWLLGTVGGQPALRKRSDDGHGFYKSAANGENEASPVSVLYIDTINGNSIIHGDGLEVSCTVGFEQDIPLGQIAFFVASLTPHDPRTQPNPAVTDIRNYWKVPFEFNIEANKVAVLLRETNDQANVTGNMAIAVPVPGNPAQCEIKGRVVGNDLVAEYRLVGASTWTSIGSQPTNISAGTPVLIGLFVEEDHFIGDPANTKYGWFKNFYAKNSGS